MWLLLVVHAVLLAGGQTRLGREQAGCARQHTGQWRPHSTRIRDATDAAKPRLAAMGRQLEVGISWPGHGAGHMQGDRQRMKQERKWQRYEEQSFQCAEEDSIAIGADRGKGIWSCSESRNDQDASEWNQWQGDLAW